MAWIQIRLNSTNQQAEIIGDYLEQLGSVSVTFMDSQDTPIFEPLPGETRLWGNTDVIALFDAEIDMSPIIRALQAKQYITDATAYKIEQIEDKDWEREWMDNFHPMQFGKRLWICPSWREVPDPQAVNVMLDPGLAFGTGTHPTTALCLEWLDSLDLQGKTIIDFGCGSGILAIAALKLGAKQAIGIDIDPQAILASRNNAIANGVENKLQLYLSNDVPADLCADVVIANILAGPLKELYPIIRTLVKPQGKLGLSGILATQAESICQCYTDSFSLDPVVCRDEWCRITGKFK
ncbi:50S ribosomal protein L11 methyltransferase [Volucribacter amazonae]|uniref:Ribosomal protein L11 methyltransferase n=1 Tax=Volucribacter amazonae TaxID=256731 RepID=A0A9X4SQX9_9PAST|nr:50S ribosomal protein L11 methyltransferase [Volucribacter amazonae]MDG6895901.1 ribosomal protein L11 methyltransferase [Volucribacter amazonae]